MLAVHGGGTPLPLACPAAGVGKAWPPDGPPRHARTGSPLVVAAPGAVASKNATLVTVITDGAVAVPPELLPAVSVPLTKPGHFLPPCG